MIKSRRITSLGHVARMGEIKYAYRILEVKSERKRPLIKPRRRWVGNFKTDFKAKRL
jgi:hypothetical protein